MTQRRTHREVPAASVGRLPGYLRAVTKLLDEGIATISSNDLADRAAVQSSLLRRDLSYLGMFGTRGLGYDVKTLVRVIGEHVGNLGRAIASNLVRNPRGFRLVTILDADPALWGTEIAGCRVSAPADLPDVFAETHPEIAILATPAAVAQEVCDRIVGAGVKAIDEFRPGGARHPRRC